ncbi:MAG: glycosyltransferase [Beijerinckiaceae bacterium]|nr:glycosyltransferase [Beijerinckiaceae bacterium]
MIVDQSLDGFLGHHHDYDMRTADAALLAGRRPIILSKYWGDAAVLADAKIMPSFRLDMWAISPGNAPWSNEDILQSNRQFHFDLVRAIDKTPIADGSVIFGHMITAKQLMGWAWFAQHAELARNVSLVLLLRYEPELYSSPLATRAFRKLEQLAGRRKIRLASDSAMLAEAYGRLTHIPVEVLPIPVRSLPEDLPTSLMERTAKPGKRPIRFGCFGNPRLDKGFLDVLSAITSIAPMASERPIEFVLQANDPGPGIEPALSTFIEDAPRNVRFLLSAMASNEYWSQLASVDVVILPYWSSVYALRTSGVFVEAVCAGKIVICSEGTWMASELGANGAGRLCREKDARSIVNAIADVVSAFDSLAHDAAAAAGRYRTFHNAGHFVARLCA